MCAPEPRHGKTRRVRNLIVRTDHKRFKCVSVDESGTVAPGFCGARQFFKTSSNGVAPEMSARRLLKAEQKFTERGPPKVVTIAVCNCRHVVLSIQTDKCCWTPNVRDFLWLNQFDSREPAFPRYLRVFCIFFRLFQVAYAGEIAPIVVRFRKRFPAASSVDLCNTVNKSAMDKNVRKLWQRCRPTQAARFLAPD